MPTSPPKLQPSKQPARLSPNATGAQFSHRLANRPSVCIYDFSHCSADWSPGRPKGLCRNRNWATAHPSTGSVFASRVAPWHLGVPRLPSPRCRLARPRALPGGRSQPQTARRRLGELQIAAYTRGSLARIADDARIQERASAIGGGWAPPTPTTPPSVLAVQLAYHVDPCSSKATAYFAWRLHTMLSWMLRSSKVEGIHNHETTDLHVAQAAEGSRFFTH